MLLVGCESLVHNNSHCLVIVQQSHSCLHQAVMARPWACQNHWAHKFDVIIPRQWTWGPVYGPCLCLTAPPSPRSVRWIHLGVSGVVVYGAVGFCFRACIYLCILKGSMANKRSVRVFVSVCVFVCENAALHMWSSDAPAGWGGTPSVLLSVGKSHPFASYPILMCRDDGFILTQGSGLILWWGGVKTPPGPILKMRRAETCAPFWNVTLHLKQEGVGQAMFPFDNVFPAGFPPAHLVFTGPLELWVRLQSASGNAWCQGITRELRSCELWHTVCACILYALEAYHLAIPVSYKNTLIYWWLHFGRHVLGGGQGAVVIHI